MSGIPSFHSHEPGPLFDDQEAIDGLLGDITYDLAHNAYKLDEAQQHASRIITAGASFSEWLAQKFPDKFGGDGALDPLTAYEFLQAFYSGNKTSDTEESHQEDL